MTYRQTADFLLYDWLGVETLQQRPRFAEHSRETFDAVLDTCERIAASFLEFWDEHRALLAVIDLAATEGDVRFREIRLQLLMSFTDALAEEVRGQRDAGRLPADLDPTATASVLVAMLAQVSGHRYGIERHGTTGPELQRALARLLYSGVTGRKPPG